jgi:putative ABC transport system permease protein
MSMLHRCKRHFKRPHLRLIALVGVIVPRRLRADWRREWEAELRHREELLDEWDRLDWRARLNLAWRSTSAFWDALWLQPKRLEDEMFQDLRYGVRMLLKNPGFTTIAVLTLALGIGANTAIFSVINAVLLRRLPYGEADRLVMVGHSWGGGLPNEISSLNYLDCRDQNNVFENTALVLWWGANLTGQGRPELLLGLQVSSGFFTTLKVQPLLGRGFLPEEDKPGNGQVVVLSHGLWQRRFGGDPQILGKQITLDDKSYTVVGIMPANFRFFPTGELEIIKPGAPAPEMSRHYHRNFETFYMIGRLKPGIGFEQAQADMKAVTKNIRRQNPGSYPPRSNGAESNWGLAARPLQEYFFGSLHKPLFLLWGAVGFVLLIACANVANLALARATSRRKEFSVRLAVGANRFRLMRQLMTESALLALIGGGLGCLLALWGIPALVALGPTKLFQTVQITADGAVLWFSLAMSLLTGVMFGLFPAIRYSKANLAEAMKEDGRGASERFCLRSPKSILVVVELALSLMLLIGAGLLLRSFDKTLRVTPGFEPQGLLAFVISLPEVRYNTDAQINSFYQQALADLKAIPGVEDVGFTSNPPLTEGKSRNIFAIEGRSYGPAQKPSGTVACVTPDYFRTMKIPLMAGRYFTEQDTASAPSVMIIDDLLAQRYFAGENPIGRRISIGKDPWREIVGVVGHVKHGGLDEVPGDAQYYYPTFQGDMESGAAVMIRSSVDPLTLVPAVQDAIQKIDKDQPIFRVRTVAQDLKNTLSQRRFMVLLLSIFAGAALALAAIGLSGVIAYSVSQRTHEIGIRMALGARASDVLRLIIGQGLKLILIGAALGLGGAFALTRLLTDFLFDVKPTDPITFLVVPILLAAVALLASYLPARRATKVDPMVALRHD